MKTLVAGEVFRGASYVDMVNNAIGTTFTKYLKSGVDLERFGCSGVMAWFVYLNGDRHGTNRNWLWKNYLSSDGKSVKEYYVGDNLNRLNESRITTGYKPYRLCFQIDPYNRGEKYCCKFLGAFCFESFLESNCRGNLYVKVFEEFKLLSRGEMSDNANKKEDFIPKTGKFITPISNMNFRQETVAFLKKININFAGQLLELESDKRTNLSTEIQHKLFEHFKEDNKSLNDSSSGFTFADFYKNSMK